MDWALEFALLGKSYLYRWENGKNPKLHTFQVATKQKITMREFKEGKLPTAIPSPDKVLVGETPVLELFSPGDRLYTSLGGLNGPFCLQALTRKVEIFRIPTHRLAQESGEQVLEEDEDAEETDDTKKDDSKAEKRRQARAKTLVRLAQKEPGLFYPMLPIDPPIIRIQDYVGSYVGMQQRMRIPTQQRMYQMRFRFAWMPEPELDEEGLKQVQRVEQIRELLETPADIIYYLELEEQFLAGIDELLSLVPSWTEFLDDITGIGPSLGGRLIAAIGDIRRFPKRDSLRAYASWSVTPDGKAPRFRRKREGQEDTGPKHDPGFKQALFLVGEQIVRQRKNAYNGLYYMKRAYYDRRDLELSKIHRHRRAVRATVSKFLNDFWAAWWKVVEECGEPLPDSVRQVLYPVPPS